MQLSVRGTLFGIVPIALAACTPAPERLAPIAAPPPDRPPLAAPAPPRSVVPNGAYVGRYGLPTFEAGQSSRCRLIPGERRFTVRNGQLRLAALDGRYAGPVAADGSVDIAGTTAASNQLPGRLTGRFEGNVFSGALIHRVGIRTVCTYPMESFVRAR